MVAEYRCFTLHTNIHGNGVTVSFFGKMCQFVTMLLTGMLFCNYHATGDFGLVVVKHVQVPLPSRYTHSGLTVHVITQARSGLCD